MRSKDFILEIYKDKRTVFTLNEIAILLSETDYSKLKQKAYYYSKKGDILNIRNGIYAKSEYNPEELACKLYSPSYISLDYVLSKAGLIFQYSDNITLISYLSRTLEVDKNILSYRKAKSEILINTKGVESKDTGVNLATKERAFLDILYLEKDFYFDNLTGLDKSLVLELLPDYRSKALSDRVNKIIKNI